MDAPLPISPSESNDVFSLSDQVLSDRLHFIEEIGFGNWGSVWLCKPKPSSTSKSKDGQLEDQKIAVKLVHRSKTPTTAARIRSLWNEMKIVRTFKSDPHPSIIPFHSFIITPSYALITMAYLPTLVPVEVDELKAREWFRFLLSAVEFLHKRGVVHNDIKPANILLSRKNIPVLVDFGFAEKYDLKSDSAFHSNLSYGTPEYLSPERARGLPHDTRKSDLWSLGVTFFEILIGRTPFENSDGKTLSTKDDLEHYWSRTLRGKWVGEWHMSKAMERMLRRMVVPNADLRCTATQAMNDPYWAYRKEKATLPSTSHRRSSSYASSIVFEKDVLRLMEAARPLTEVNPENPSPLDLARKPSKQINQPPHITRVRSQPKVASPKPTPRKRAAPIGELPPVKPSPSPFSRAAGKENIRTFNALATSTSSRRPLGPLVNRETSSRVVHADTRDKDKGKEHGRKSRVFGDSTSRRRNAENDVGPQTPPVVKKRDPVRDRVREWERERERMREMARLEEIKRDPVRDRVREWERERERMREMARLEEIEREREEEEEEEEMKLAKEKTTKREKANLETKAVGPPTPSTSSFSPVHSSFASVLPVDYGVNHRVPLESSDIARPPSVNDSDKTMNLCKSTASQLTGRSTPVLTVTSADDEHDSKCKSDETRESWEDDILLHSAPSGLPSVRQAARDERIAADARMDRLTIWMRNVEKVVEDARQTFASSSSHELKTLPSLPVAPLSRSQSRTNGSHRLPRKILAANQIFANDEIFNVSTANDSYVTATDTSTSESRGQLQLSELELNTPARKRRATVSDCALEKVSQGPDDLDVATSSPSKRREKSKSHGSFLQLHIAPISMLDAEFNKSQLPPPPPSAQRLSDVLDSRLFIAPPLSPQPPSSPREEDQELDMRNIVPPVRVSKSSNDLHASPFHVEPYPARPASMQIPPPDTPTQRRIEGVYDRFLMATSGVKRLGKGYQSDNTGPASTMLSSGIPPAYRPRPEKKLFQSTRRLMPPAVSSDDVQLGPTLVDELGVIGRGPAPMSTDDDAFGGHTILKDDGKTTVALVRRAFKAMVPGKTSRRPSSRNA
ncbi:hypothetical protein C0995_015344 [Termitomyces sp. Mi166|nr:hypothetical protein C0995_015344 [Termitomyces sp. Mi166\